MNVGRSLFQLVTTALWVSLGWVGFFVASGALIFIGSEVAAVLKNDEMSQYEDALCHAQFICAKLSDVRQQCAIAGDFKNCVTVKMGDVYYDYACLNDGQVAGVDRAKMPNQLECLLRNFKATIAHAAWKAPNGGVN